MYPKLLSAAVAAGMFPGTCGSTLSLYGPPFQEPTLSVATDSDFDFARGGKTALFMETSDPPPGDDEPAEVPGGVHDPQ